MSVPIKSILTSAHFAYDDDVKHAVHTWLERQSKDWFEADIGALTKRWEKCYGGLRRK